MCRDQVTCLHLVGLPGIQLAEPEDWRERLCSQAQVRCFFGISPSDVLTSLAPQFFTILW